MKDTKSQEWNEKGGSIEIFGKFQTVTLEGEKWTEQWIDSWSMIETKQYLPGKHKTIPGHTWDSGQSDFRWHEQLETFF